MVVPKDTPYKTLSFLNRIFLEKSVLENYINEKVLIHLINRGHLSHANGRIHSTAKFEEVYLNEIQPLYLDLQSFLGSHKLQKIQNHYSLGDIETLKLIATERELILSTGLSFQQILSMYFISSKYTQLKSGLANAIKVVLGISNFHEDEKDQQYISILYPSKMSRAIILCENKNRLKIPRHSTVEFWYGGGRNIVPLAFAPKPTLPMFYLFDWDHHGVSIFIELREKYFPQLHAFIPINHSSLYVNQERIRNHRSKWTETSTDFLKALTHVEGQIVSQLIDTDNVLEEQRIITSEENLKYNFERLGL